MRTLLLAFFVGSWMNTNAQVNAPDAGYEAIVTIHVSDLSAEGWNAVSVRIGKEPGANIEYSCARAGILVLRMQHLAVTEKVDVMTIAQRLLREAGVKGEVEFLNVFMSQQDWGECRNTGTLRRAAASM